MEVGINSFMLVLFSIIGNRNELHDISSLKNLKLKWKKKHLERKVDTQKGR